ncbi:epoxyqueuosine reductase QueH [Nanoarchaeota archaeon]
MIDNELLEIFEKEIDELEENLDLEKENLKEEEEENKQKDNKKENTIKIREKVLLHVCCAPCASFCIEQLKKKYDITLFFSNSNIYPKEEYDKRLENAEKIAGIHKLNLIEDKYDHDSWKEHVKGLEKEPEGRNRCKKCFEFNLIKTAKYAMQNSFDFFTTTLTISPHKDSQKIFEIAKALPNFLEIDFKQDDGFDKSVELSKKHNLYRQNYCGCEFSKKE